MGFFACGLGTEPDTRPVVDWEEPRCLLCNANDRSLLVEAPDPLPGGGGLWFAVTQCQDCGLCYTNPRPRAEGMGQFYSRQYPPHHKSFKKASGWWRWPFAGRGRHKHLERLPVQGQGRLLDFGCGSGAFIMRMHQRGWKVTGLDTSEETVQRIRAKFGLSVLAGSLPHPELGESSFELIAMRHSLEHVHQPLEVLRAAHQLLVPGGQLMVSVPNIDSLPFKWFGRHWRGLDLPRHLTHFTPDTLQLMLARAGFDVGPVRMVRHPEWVRHSAFLASKRPDAPRWLWWLRGRTVASLATWYTYLARRSDAMVIVAVKSLPMEMQPVEAFSQHATDHRRFPVDRWRDR
jgi:2-polyprenyl-3-methyl-5-hydroxy-6-metoxy-1,4-benzoquinol methylase